jgi:polyphosphate kinase
MVRSFERRLESLFLLADEVLKKQAINILRYNLKDNVNTYIMHEDGNYIPKEANDEPPFDIHKKFFEVTLDIVMEAKLF